MYEQVAIGWSHDLLTTLKSVQNHLVDLTMLGFLERTERNDDRADGIHYLYELTLDPEVVFGTWEAIEIEVTHRDLAKEQTK